MIGVGVGVPLIRECRGEAPLQIPDLAHWTRPDLGATLVAGAGALTGNPNLTFAAKTITRAAGSWLTDGFLADTTIVVAGSASNNRSYTIVSLTATVITTLEDTVAEGPSAGITVTSSYQRVSALANQGGSLGGSLAQATAALQPTLVTLGTQPALRWHAVASALLGSTLAASAWKYLHDGTGSTLFCVQMVSNGGIAFSTLRSAGGPTRVGVDLYQSAETMILLVGNGSGVYAVNKAVASSTTRVHSHIVRFSTAGWVWWVDGVSAASGVPGAPSAADPFGALAIGNYTGGGGGNLLGTQCDVATWKRYLTDLEATRLASYARARWGTP